MPWSARSIGSLDHLVYCLLVEVELFAVAPVFVSDLPALLGVLLPGLEACQLGVLIDVEPELDHNGAEIREVLLHFVDLAEGPFPLGVRAKGFHTLDKDATVPGTIEYMSYARASSSRISLLRRRPLPLPSKPSMITTAGIPSSFASRCTSPSLMARSLRLGRPFFLLPGCVFISL